MRVLSVCSGIGAAELAFTRLGMSFAASADIEPFPNAVRAVHFPEVPNWGDMTKFQEWPDADVNVVVGGTPCQSFSVAGLRKGLADPRGNLALTFLAIAARYAPRWILWENVPGVLSSGGGRDFGSFLGALAELGYGFAYRVLDAQFFGLAQRRKRVFVVGYLGDWRPAAAVLFERESLSGHPPPSRKAGARVAGTLEARAGTGGYDPGAHGAASGHLIASTGNVSRCLNAGGMGRQDYETETLVAHTLRGVGIGDDGDPMFTLQSGKQHAVAFDLRGREGGAQFEGPHDTANIRAASGGSSRSYVAQPAVFSIMPQNSGKDYKAREVDVAQPLMTSPVGGNQGGDYVMQPAVAYSIAGNMINRSEEAGPAGPGFSDGAMFSLTKFDVHAVQHAMAVRRLTPVECARLQGFPDDYLDITYGGKPAADGPKYKALGNSMAVPVMSWLGGRIQMVDAMLEAA